MAVVQRMAEHHISIPTSFVGGDVAKWFQRFEMCSRANRWDVATNVFKAPHVAGERGPRDMDGSKRGREGQL